MQAVPLPGPGTIVLDTMTTPQPVPATEPPRRSAQLLRFTTRGLTPEARVQLWEGHNARALARLLRTTMTSLADPARAAVPDLATVETEVLALLRLILAGPDSSAGGVVAAARDFIDRNLTDPELGPGKVAAAVGVSERQLARYVADADTTVSRHIQSCRVALAADLLASGEHERLSVADIAARAGFASPSHFGRVFRQYREVTPLQFRKQAAREWFA